MVLGVAPGVHRLEGARAEGEPRAVLDLDHPLGRYRHEAAVEPLELRVAVDLASARFELGRVDEVARGPGMGHETRARKGLEEGGRPAGVVEVRVGHDHVAHGLRGQTPLLHRREDEGSRLRRAGFDHRDLVALLAEENRGETRPHVHAVDDPHPLFHDAPPSRG